eukprot:CAMPEP_0113821014 /NCGR_PEP_ID=MMETSP0328-20130328/1526_1 /TAXON_ID=39455 /ORGANISM="Alexandrium minutum" /LENGTH=109 /DNA_ID=CAMNT_0000788945 /DNA_START=186 /DNA_END=515 /DNA_ORIENTATION=+ /assembly_acc=CAM_ASM_000350
MAQRLALLHLHGLVADADASLLVDVVVHDLLDQVDVREQHATAAIPAQAQGIEHLPLAHLALEHLKIALPLVPDQLAARVAADGDDHRCWPLPLGSAQLGQAPEPILNT